MKINIPKDVRIILNQLNQNGYKAYIVGGCVRDSLLNRTPKDWDITTSATPQQVKVLFNHVIPTGEQYGTVTVMLNKEGYEVTTFRSDGNYSDGRRPDTVEFSSSLIEDLSRRDLTINALAYNELEGIIDYYSGIDDLINKRIKCVGSARERLSEDALRMIRAIRFSSQLGFDIDQKIIDTICSNSNMITNVSIERIREELCKILVSNKPVDGICHLVQSGLMQHIIPELMDTVKFNQYNKHHHEDVFMHIMSVLRNTSNDLTLRLSALFHDIGKPRCLTFDDNREGHFINHHKIGADMTRNIMSRLRFDNKTINDVSELVYSHMISDEMGRVGTRKLIKRMESVDLTLKCIELFRADRKAVNDKNADEKADEFIKMILDISEKKEPTSVNMLCINGNDIMKACKLKPSPLIGALLRESLDAVMNDEINNERNSVIEYVKGRMESGNYDK